MGSWCVRNDKSGHAPFLRSYNMLSRVVELLAVLVQNGVGCRQ